jgi:CubicO group peptidase (beta-lactamase class C family)
MTFGAAGAVPHALPPDAEIRKILAERVAEENGVGIVVGIIGPQGRRIISSGEVNGNTRFELGSVAKVFTALLLADMVRRGEVGFDDPVAKYIPELAGRAITLADLATHTSGLPFMPSEQAITSAAIYQDLARYPHHSGLAAWDYSNLGYWLLGEALAARAGTTYEGLVRKRVLQPLGLKDTVVTLSPTQPARVATGHDASLQPAPPAVSVPRYAMMSAAGVGWFSTANDLLTFLAFALGYQRSPLTPAMKMMLETRRATGVPATAQALGWLVAGTGDDTLIVHDGGTLGYASSVAWDPKLRIGVVVLSNQIAEVGDIARHLLRPNVALTKPTVVKHTEIALDPKVLDSYAGRYDAKDEGVFSIIREDGGLVIESPSDWGLPKLKLHPESQIDFFASELPLRVTFQTGEGGVAGMVIYPPRGQKGVAASRIR